MPLLVEPSIAAATVAADNEALMPDGEEARRPAGTKPVFLYNGDGRHAWLPCMASSSRRTAVCATVTASLLLGALVAAAALAPRGRGAEGAGTELFTDGQTLSLDVHEVLPGCCTWDGEHCGQAGYTCNSGLEKCSRCHGKWMSLPRIWNYTGPRVWNQTSGRAAPARVKVLSYNLYWWKLFGKQFGRGGIAGHLIKRSAGGVPYDVMGFQECNEPYRVLWDAGVDGQYKAIHTNINICIAWRTKVWDLIEHGVHVVAQDASWSPPGQNFGQRQAMWVRLRHKETSETLFFMNHHGPLPLSSGGDWGSWETGRRLLDLIARTATEGEPVVLVGDFNSARSSATVKQVGSRLHRVLSGTKFGGVDHVFTNLDRSHVVSAQILGQGGSDHNALNAILDLGHPLSVHF